MAVEEHEGLPRDIHTCAVHYGSVPVDVHNHTVFYQQITDTFIVNENALQNLEEHTDVLIFMLAAMVGFTLLRCGLQYGSNMMYEHTSQTLIYRVRKVLFDKIENQDAAFYNVYHTGDIMTRVSADLDMVRHSIAWIIKTIVECIVLFSASLIFFFTMDWLMALCMISLGDTVDHVAFQAQGRPPLR